MPWTCLVRSANARYWSRTGQRAPPGPARPPGSYHSGAAPCDQVRGQDRRRNAAGIGPHRPVGGVGQLDLLEHPPGPLPPFGPAQMVKSRPTSWRFSRPVSISSTVS
jgi:hypothetical protein